MTTTTSMKTDRGISALGDGTVCPATSRATVDAANQRAMAKNAQPNGWNAKELVRSPCPKALHDRVIPHEGQGSPVASRNGHRVGPDVTSRRGRVTATVIDTVERPASSRLVTSLPADASVRRNSFVRSWLTRPACRVVMPYLRARPPLSGTLRMAMRMKSISAQKPQPPRVRSLAMPKPV